MPNELKAIKEGIKSAGLKINLDIDYLCCGIGNYETISSLERYLTQNPEPTFIWNIGICGYWNPNNEKKSEPIQVASIVNIHTEKEMITPPFIRIAPLKTCFSGENVILERPKFQKEIGAIDNEMFFDMESWGIELVVSKYKYPHLILKLPFDFIGEETKSLKNEKPFKNMEIPLEKLPYYEYLEKILGWIRDNE